MKITLFLLLRVAIIPTFAGSKKERGTRYGIAALSEEGCGENGFAISIS